MVLCKICKISNFKDEEVEVVDVIYDVEDGIGEFVERFVRMGLDD